MLKHALQWCVVFIVGVCIYDIYLTVTQHDLMRVTEENPIAALFLRETQIVIVNRDLGTQRTQLIVVHESTDVSLLVLVKTIGLIIALLMMQRILRTVTPQYAAMILFPVTLVQVWLLCYLLF